MLAGFAVALFFVYWACAGFAAWLARRFGARWRLQGHDAAAAPLSTRAGFVTLIFAISLASFILEPAANTFSRHFEHEADVYGQEAIHGSAWTSASEASNTRRLTAERDTPAVSAIDGITSL